MYMTFTPIIAPWLRQLSLLRDWTVTHPAIEYINLLWTRHKTVDQCGMKLSELTNGSNVTSKGTNKQTSYTLSRYGTSQKQLRRLLLQTTSTTHKNSYSKNYRMYRYQQLLNYQLIFTLCSRITGNKTQAYCLGHNFGLKSGDQNFPHENASCGWVHRWKLRLYLTDCNIYILVLRLYKQAAHCTLNCISHIKMHITYPVWHSTQGAETMYCYLKTKYPLEVLLKMAKHLTCIFIKWHKNCTGLSPTPHLLKLHIRIL